MRLTRAAKLPAVLCRPLAGAVRAQQHRGGSPAAHWQRRALHCSEGLKAEHDAGSQAACCPPPTRVIWRCARPAASGREWGGRVVTCRPRCAECCPYDSCGREADAGSRAARKLPQAKRSAPWHERGGHLVTRRPRCTERSPHGSGGPEADAGSLSRAARDLPQAGHCAGPAWQRRGSRCDSPSALRIVLLAPPKRSRDGCAQSSGAIVYRPGAVRSPPPACRGAGAVRALRGKGRGSPPQVGRSHMRARPSAGPSLSPLLPIASAPVGS